MFDHGIQLYVHCCIIHSEDATFVKFSLLTLHTCSVALVWMMWESLYKGSHYFPHSISYHLQIYKFWLSFQWMCHYIQHKASLVWCSLIDENQSTNKTVGYHISHNDTVNTAQWLTLIFTGVDFFPRFNPQWRMPMKQLL